MKHYIDLQLVAFPQDGLYRVTEGEGEHHPGARSGRRGRRRHSAFRTHHGRWPGFSVTELCEIAAERGLMVDMHCDETDDPMSRHIEQLAYETQRLGLQGRVAGSHLTSMHSMDNYYVSKLLPLIAEAEVAAIPNPLINITHTGPPRHLSEAARHDPGAGNARPRHQGRLRSGLRARPVVSAGHGRHA
jgi:cytosine deaminase